MKKIFSLISFLMMLIILLASCSPSVGPSKENTTTTTATTTTTTTSTTTTTKATTTTTQIIGDPSAGPDPTEPPNDPIPLSFESMDNLISFLKTTDYSYISSPSYFKKNGIMPSNPYYNTYNHMVKIFNDNGYLYEIDNSENKYQISRIYICHEFKKEDSGISYWVKHNGAEYYVIIYNVKADIEIDENSPSIKDYCKSRFGNDLPGKIVSVSSEFYSEINIKYIDGDNYTMGFIDPSHYAFIRSTESEETIIEFIEQLNFIRRELN